MMSSDVRARMVVMMANVRTYEETEMNTYFENVDAIQGNVHTEDRTSLYSGEISSPRAEPTGHE